MNFKRILLMFVCLTFLIFIFSISIAAQTDWSKYPEKNINVVVVAKAGGSTDMTLQLIKSVLDKSLNIAFVPLYKEGAGGVVGFTYLVQNTKPDGYTIAVGTFPAYFSNLVIKPEEVNYKFEDTVGIANLITDPATLVVKADSKINTFEDFINYCKEKPNLVTVGDGGTGGDDWSSTRFIERATGIKVVSVPFLNEAEAVQAAAGGHIVAASCNVGGSTYNLITGGLIKPLVVFAEERSSFLPDVPTAKELGYDIIAGSSRGFIAKKGTPMEAIEILSKAILQAANDPQVQENAKKLGLSLNPRNVEEYNAFTRNEYEKFKVMWEEYNK